MKLVPTAGTLVRCTTCGALTSLRDKNAHAEWHQALIDALAHRPYNDPPKT